MTQSRLHSIFVILAGASALVAGSGTALAGDIQLKMDQVRVVSIKTPFKSISVGNPLIADATVIDENHVFVVGKEFGTTNLVAVDDEGNQVAEEMITVTTQQGRMVTLQRGANWSTLTCNAERCDVRPTPAMNPRASKTSRSRSANARRRAWAPPRFRPPRTNSPASQQSKKGGRFAALFLILRIVFAAVSGRPREARWARRAELDQLASFCGVLEVAEKVVLNVATKGMV